jgi:hypothetical protein
MITTVTRKIKATATITKADGRVIEAPMELEVDEATLIKMQPMEETQ